MTPTCEFECKSHQFLIIKNTMARPQIYATEEQRQAAKRASWQKYNVAHKAERAAHNKVYCQREDVKAKRRENYRAKKLETVNSTERD